MQSCVQRSKKMDTAEEIFLKTDNDLLADVGASILTSDNQTKSILPPKIEEQIDAGKNG